MSFKADLIFRELDRYPILRRRHFIKILLSLCLTNFNKPPEPNLNRSSLGI